MLNEFKAFIMRGNVIDLAVGVIIGAAFGKITTSLVDDVIMPPLGKLIGGGEFQNLKINLGVDAQAQSVDLRYGVFINTIINFLIISAAVFLLIKALNALKRKEEAKPAEAATKDCPYCTSSIPIKAIRCPQCTAELTARLST